MPPDGDIEFIIDLYPGTPPIAKRPYGMSSKELVEPKGRLGDCGRRALSDPVLPHGEPPCSLYPRKMEGAKYFSKIDLRSRLPSAQDRRRRYTQDAFVTGYGRYEFTVMPFGLTNAPAYFMNLMNKIFMDGLDKYVIVFIDDILVYSKTIEEHEEHLRKVPEKLRSHRLYAKFGKCELRLERISYTGHIITAKG
ncbi:hypothetical protein U9M48_014752 [Paspalum notatum var. saurae]|uniref:Reverse transcriptase domain-containing protein n=1 Tax=Paspalum notatum var. saurae TaxID=547442 RepID=A0AAQ3T1S7_PASNO